MLEILKEIQEGLKITLKPSENTKFEIVNSILEEMESQPLKNVIALYAYIEQLLNIKIQAVGDGFGILQAQKYRIRELQFKKLIRKLRRRTPGYMDESKYMDLNISDFIKLTREDTDENEYLNSSDCGEFEEDYSKGYFYLTCSENMFKWDKNSQTLTFYRHNKMWNDDNKDLRIISGNSGSFNCFRNLDI